MSHEGDAHFVYTARNAEGVAIYVGCTYNLRKRVQEHGSTSPWWRREVASVEHEVYPDRTSGLDAETEAIRREQPFWNVQGPLLPRDWDAYNRERLARCTA